MATTIEIQNDIRGNIFLNFGYIETLDPPNVVHDAPLMSDFSNPIDLSRLKHVMEDEGIDPIIESRALKQTFMNQFRVFHQHQGFLLF